MAFDCGEYFCTGNEELLKQVWINLIDNAIKFSPEQETVEISIREQEGFLRVSFTNKGAPIPEPALSHVFDKFYQGDTSHATQGNGVGTSHCEKGAGASRRVFGGFQPARYWNRI